MPRFSRPFPLLLACFLAPAGCGDDASGRDTTSGSTGGVPVGTDSEGTGELPTSTTGPSSSTDPGTDTDAPGQCSTILCGQPAVCCDVGDECVLGACMPECASGVRCGEAQDVCCDAGQVCLGLQCETPTGQCVDSFDCEIGEFCEPTLGQCLPQLDPVTCEIQPEFEDIDVTLEWSWEDEQVISTPAVADLDGDGVPEVILNVTQLDGLSWPGGAIVVLNGQTGAELWRLEHDPNNGSYGSHGRSSIGVTDVSGDGLPDIVYAGRASSGRSLIHAVDGQGTLLWSSHDPDDSPHTFAVVNGAPSFGNFDDDPEAEIVFGASLIDHDGTVVWDQDGNGAAFGTNGSYTGGISAIVDLTADGYPEIVSGRHAWSVDWTEVGGVPTVNVTQLWDAGAPDGWPAIADLDLDGNPEVVLTASGTIRVLEGDNGLAWCGVDPTQAACNADPGLRTAAVAIPGGGLGGPPTIADFDGDGWPEIAAAGGSSYSVYDLYRQGEEIVQPAGDPAAAPGEVFVRWSQPTQDLSSNATGSSVFDFQGDGIAEVVYADECYMRVYSGDDGAIILEAESSSATIHEYPIVVDVDNDGNSEIVVVANNAGGSCSGIPGYTMRQGVFVYGDTFDQWVQTRRVWTSHTYHVTNATSAGITPMQEQDNWTQPGLNNYRQNVQGAGVFNAPDLTVELSVGLGDCLQEELQLIATVRNQGALGVPAGVPVQLYEGTDATGALIDTQPTPQALLPGQQVEVVFTVDFPQGTPAKSYFVAVDGEVGGTVIECDESNNTGATETEGCAAPG